MRENGHKGRRKQDSKASEEKRHRTEGSRTMLAISDEIAHVRHL
jgi:hypothetical protein